MDGSGSEMTLAFELSALEQLADPSTVFDDARQWSTYVGVISDEPTYVVTNFTRQRRIRQDFFSGPQGKKESLKSVKTQFDTDRHVFIGTSDDDEDLAGETSWEYLAVEDAAEAAEWELASSTDDTDVFDEEQRDDWP